MAIEPSTGAWQDTNVDPKVVPVGVVPVAEIVAVPAMVALGLQVTRPAADTVAALGLSEAHVAELVRSRVD